MTHSPDPQAEDQQTDTDPQFTEDHLKLSYPGLEELISETNSNLSARVMVVPSLMTKTIEFQRLENGEYPWSAQVMETFHTKVKLTTVEISYIAHTYKQARAIARAEDAIYNSKQSYTARRFEDGSGRHAQRVISLHSGPVYW